VTRAEPASSLYEQGRIHHVGTFSQLEDQMTNFTSDFDRAAAGYSPDRVDALVWALTELLVEPMKGFNIFELMRRRAAGETLEQIAGTAQRENPPHCANVAERRDIDRPGDVKAERPIPPTAGGPLMEVYLRAKNQIITGRW
jgi:hypothetical protein